MYAIKIMSGENLADSDVGKGFKIILVDANTPFEFGHSPTSGEPYVQIWCKGESVQHPLTGNAYVMNEDGKTIASFWGRRKQVVVTLDKEDPAPERTIEHIQSIIKEVANRPEQFPGLPKVTYKLDKDGTCLLKMDGECLTFVTESQVNFNTYTPEMEEKRTQWSVKGMTRRQIDLLANGPTKLASDAIDRENARRFRVAYLMAQGIPQDIAMEATTYMVAVDSPSSPNKNARQIPVT